MLKPIAALLFMLTFATAATAQDGSEAVTNRTPASAQLFLSSEAPLVANMTITRVAEGNEYIFEYRYEKVTNIRSDDVCRTIFHAEPILTKYRNPTTGALHRTDSPNAGEHWEPVATPDPARSPHDITVDWSKVKGVEPVAQEYHEEIWLPTTDTSDSVIKINWGLSTRDRAIVAMKYLQAACDRTAQTGF